MTNYTVTADNGRVNISFTFGLGVLNDTDGDRLPDEPSLTGLETDLDDDNDGHLDEIEVKCGSDPVDQTSVPTWMKMATASKASMLKMTAMMAMDS